MTYRPTTASLKTHAVPAWYHDAKLGIFIHWGLYSVPGWAVPVKGLHGLPTSNVESPYAEWYQNMLRYRGSQVWQYHHRTYGDGFAYDDFAPIFERESARMDAVAWAHFIKATGARYTVLTTKHHDGYTLWPSRHLHPKKAGWGARRDLVGDLATAVRSAGLRFGVYYSGIYDWSFQPRPIVDVYDGVVNGVSSLSYARYCYAQFTELIERYRPDILWNDIGYPALGRVKKLLAYYYNTVPEGVANNRWWTWWLPSSAPVYPVSKAILKLAVALSDDLRHMLAGEDLLGDDIPLGDYATPEFASLPERTAWKWETTRGLGSSFGYNRNEDTSTVLTGDTLIRMLVDIVSKNGNLLINIGPMADGTIPDYQQKPLLALGAWLAKNGEAIYGTRPWHTSGAVASDGTEVRFTRGPRELFVFLLQPEGNRTIVIKDLGLKDGGRVRLLNGGRAIGWSSQGQDLALHLPALPEAETVPVLRIEADEIRGPARA